MLTTERGCGRRKAGGLYLEVPTSPFGQPIEHFLICPPILPNFDLPTQGQLPFWNNDVLHLVDWIGAGYYPNVTDWIEEARVLGISTRVSLQMADRDAGNEANLSVLEALTSESKLWFAHPRAFIHNVNDYRWGSFLNILPWKCPKSVEGHPDSDPNENPDYGPPCCVGIYWWDLDEGDPAPVPEGVEMLAPERLVRRRLPCNHTYVGRTRPESVEPEYSPAIFARFPVIQLTLVRGENDEHVPVREKLESLNLNIPVMEMDE